MNSPAHDIAGYLASLPFLGDLHGTMEWGVHVGAEPTAPDSVLTLYDLPGGEPDTDELDEFRPVFQVRARSLQYTAAYATHESVREALIHDTIVCETSQFSLIVLSSDIAAIGRDSNNRHILTATYRSRRTQKES